MSGKLKLCLIYVCSIYCLKFAFGNFNYLTKGNFSYTSVDIIENVITPSLLQCSHRCAINTGCTAMEWHDVNSTCVILKDTTLTSDKRSSEQYIRWIQHGDTYYYRTREPYDWYTCVDKCTALGGNLASETSIEETMFIDTFKYVWIGAHKINGSWVWVNGETWNYTSWGPDEPNTNARCVLHYGPTNRWNDTPCGSKVKCACEKK